MAVFSWRRLRGWRCWGALLLGLFAVRVCYVPILALALIAGSWLEWAGRSLGARGLVAPLTHYALGCFVALLASLAALLAVAAAAHLRHVGWVLVLVVLVALGVLCFVHPADRTLSPHPIASRPAPAPTGIGPAYIDVAESGEFAIADRVLAAGAAARHLLTPRNGWGGAIRDELLARFRGAPAMPLADRVRCFEAAMLAARRTFPRTPRASSARRPPARS